MTPVLFVSGAGLPPWIWDEVRDATPANTRVAARPAARASLADYADAALRTAIEWDSFIVVAHSSGGVVAQELVARAPERVSAMLAISACLPAPGRSFLDSMPFPQRHVLGLIMRVAGTRPPAKEIRDNLCHGVPAEVAERIVEEFTPESQGLYRDRVSGGGGTVPTTYAVTLRDRLFTVPQQRAFAAQREASIRELETAHLPMLERADLVTDLIRALVRQRS